MYSGTVVPRSFELTTEGGRRIWVHGNATKHLNEYAQMKLAAQSTPASTMMATQGQLASLRAAVSAATKKGVVCDKFINVGGWELKFAAGRNSGDLPVLIHALMK